MSNFKIKSSYILVYFLKINYLHKSVYHVEFDSLKYDEDSL